MTHAIKWLYLLTLAAWIGSIIFFSFIVAPTVFRTLKPDDAGLLIRRIFAHYYLLGIISSAIAIVCLSLLLHDRSFAKWPAILSLLLVAAMGATDLFLRQGVMPHMNSLRDRRANAATATAPPTGPHTPTIIRGTSSSTDTQPTTIDPALDREWQSLHRLSVRLNVVVLLSGFVLIFLVVYARVV
ncbi:MAG TPA: DUF4149 domain-containing protein [Verrucomicrobiae bacterium]|nr:DUF4149 domain-containing protein [Verrucomicrobiae bacterium]